LAAVCRQASADFPQAPMTAQLFSSLKKSGIEEAERIIGGWLQVSPPVKEGLEEEGCP
jgi:GTP-binding protein